jgi:UDP-N-acetylmuramoyl-tripeptide--D-alanyl-D-alanine ligase
VFTDTHARPGALFVAVKGDSFDGRDFLSGREGGGAAVLVTRARRARLPAIVVADTVIALGQLARAHARASGPVVAITGSNGKTTTKELCARARGRGARASDPGQSRNHIGLPLDLGPLETDEVLVVELGMNHAGEIDALTAIADRHRRSPTWRRLTGLLGSLQAIAAAKGELFARMRADATAIVNADDPNCVTQSAPSRAEAALRAARGRRLPRAWSRSSTGRALRAVVPGRRSACACALRAAPGRRRICAASAAYATGARRGAARGDREWTREFSGRRVALLRAPNGVR